MVTNVLIFTSSWDIRRFATGDCWTQTVWRV